MEITPRPVHCAIISASDTRTLETDLSGKWIEDELLRHGHLVAQRRVIQEDMLILQQALAQELDAGREALIFTGGTGITRRDISPDVVAQRSSKEIVGFGELFRYLSFAQIGASTIQSRAGAWLCDKTIVFVLPGSLSAVQLAMEKIIMPQLDIRTKPCNFPMLFPRL
jgi:molybdenum cofactor biosynthesis protein B